MARPLKRPSYKIRKHKQSQTDVQELVPSLSSKYSLFQTHMRELQNLLELSRECRYTMEQCCARQKIDLSTDTISDLDLDSTDESLAPGGVGGGGSSAAAQQQAQQAQQRRHQAHPFLIDKLTAVKYKVPERVLEHDPAGYLMEYRGCYVCRSSFVDWWIGEGPWPTVSGVAKIARYFRNNRTHLRTVMSESGIACDEDDAAAHEKELCLHDDFSKSCSSLRIDLK